jgi:hypothetical protein
MGLLDLSGCNSLLLLLLLLLLLTLIAQLVDSVIKPPEIRLELVQEALPRGHLPHPWAQHANLAPSQKK